MAAYRTLLLSVVMLILAGSPVLAQDCCITVTMAEEYLQLKDWLPVVSARLNECVTARAASANTKPAVLKAVAALGTADDVLVFQDPHKNKQADRQRLYLNTKAATKLGITVTLDGKEADIKQIPKGSLLILIGKTTPETACRIHAIQAYSPETVKARLGLVPSK